MICDSQASLLHIPTSQKIIIELWGHAMKNGHFLHRPSQIVFILLHNEVKRTYFGYFHLQCHFSSSFGLAGSPTWAPRLIAREPHLLREVQLTPY